MAAYAAHFLVVLMVLLVGFCFGYMIGSMNRPTPIDRENSRREPYVEHESDAPYPRYWE